MTLRFAALACCLLVTFVHAQDPAPEGEQSSPSVIGAWTDAATMAAEPVAELRLELLPLTTEELERAARLWMDELEAGARELTVALVDRQRLVGDSSQDAADRRARIDAGIASLRELVSGLSSRTGIVLDTLEARGGDVVARERYLTSVQALLAQAQPPQAAVAAPTEAEPQLTPQEREARALAAKVDALAKQIEEEPPIHERPEPWTISISALTDNLQPLRRSELEKRLDAWLNLVQAEVRKRNRLRIAAEQQQDQQVLNELIARADRHQATINLLVERVRAVMTMIERRGGDTSEAKRYITNATGAQFNFANPAVLYAQTLSWLRSPDGGIAVGLRLFTFLAIVVGAWFVSRLAGSVVTQAVKRIPKASSLLREFLVGGVKRTIMLIGIVIAVSRLGIDITPLVAAIGAAGLVIGLALQGTLSNFASGILILIYRPYDVGDVIEGGGTAGKVEAMNLVSTRIVTFDNQVNLVPNNQIWNNVITNLTGRDTRRVDLVVGVSYGANLQDAADVLERTAKAHPLTLETPAPMIKVGSLGDSSVNFLVRPWAKTSDYWDVYWDLTRQLKEALDAAGIPIPFPHRQLNLPGPIEVVVKSG